MSPLPLYSCPYVTIEMLFRPSKFQKRPLLIESLVSSLNHLSPDAVEMPLSSDAQNPKTIKLCTNLCVEKQVEHRPNSAVNDACEGTPDTTDANAAAHTACEPFFAVVSLSVRQAHVSSQYSPYGSSASGAASSGGGSVPLSLDLPSRAAQKS